MKNQLAAFDFDDTRQALIIPDMRAIGRLKIIDSIDGQRHDCLVAPVIVEGKFLTFEAIVDCIVAVSYKPCLL